MHNFWLYLQLVVVLLVCQYARADIFAECEGVDDETFVASWESCQTYVYCMGEDSASGDCDEGEYFDAESGSCDLAENVQCFLDEPSIEEPEPEIDGPEIIEATPPTETNEVDILNIAPLIKPNCPQSDDPNQMILMASNESCSAYYICYHGHAMEMHCNNQLHFNTESGQCDHPEQAHCALSQPTAHKCLPHVTDFFPHPDKCNYFYYCIKGYLTLQQCPFYYGWDVERRSCVHMNVAKCFDTAKRT